MTYYEQQQQQECSAGNNANMTARIPFISSSEEPAIVSPDPIHRTHCASEESATAKILSLRHMSTEYLPLSEEEKQRMREELKPKKGLVIGSDEWDKDVERREAIRGLLRAYIKQGAKDINARFDRIERQQRENGKMLRELKEYPMFKRIEQNRDYYSQFM